MSALKLRNVLENIRSVSFSLSFDQFCQKLSLSRNDNSAIMKHRALVSIGSALQVISPEEIELLLGSVNSTFTSTYPLSSSYPQPDPTDDKASIKTVEDLLTRLTTAKDQSMGNRARHYAICVTKLEDVLFRLKVIR